MLQWPTWGANTGKNLQGKNHVAVPDVVAAAASPVVSMMNLKGIKKKMTQGAPAVVNSLFDGIEQ